MTARRVHHASMIADLCYTRPVSDDRTPKLRKAAVRDRRRHRDQGRLRPRRRAAATRTPPGEFPFTRGVQPTMYRGQLWTMRQYAGFGTAAESNERYQYLLAQGGKGLSVAFDLPTQMGRDSDHPMARGEVGRVGVAIDSLEDMRVLFDGIPLDEVSTSMTINATAATLLALYIAVGEEQGVAARQAARHDPERHPQGVHRARHVHLSAAPARCASSPTSFAYCSKRGAAVEHDLDQRLPHPRGRLPTPCRRSRSRSPTASRTSKAAIDAGLDVDEFAPRLSFFFNVHNNFLEEVAKFRAARRMWAKIMQRPLRREDAKRARCCASTRRPPA